jgi:hypothetical protein
MKFKRLLYIAVITVITLGISNNSVAQNVSHTFVVDGKLPLKSEKIRVEKGDEIAKYWAENENAGKVIATSWGNDNMYVPNHSIFFDCLVQAYANHYSLALSPDIIWTVISQEFNYYINNESEAMRDRIVSHQGKMTLAVETKEDLYSPNVKWEELLDGFDKQIAENTKGNIADMMRADFSTTGKTERIASQITLMSSVKRYFEYVSYYIVCGIPSITIEGTPDDWKKVIEKTEILRNYDLGWWVDNLTPILNEFVAAAEGKANRAFWQNIVMKLRPDEMRELGCMAGWSDEEPTYVDGWFLKLMPFNKKGRTPRKVSCETNQMLPNVASAPFTYKVLDNLGNTISSTPMNMVAGLVGVDVNDNVMRPRIGWMVCENNGPTFEERVASGEGLHIKNDVPEEIRHIKYIPKLDISFAGEVKIPNWIDTMKIDVILLCGKISPELKTELPKRFPDRKLYIFDDACEIISKTRQAPDDHVFRVFSSDDEPKFPGEDKAFDKYIEKNRRIPISKNNQKDKDEKKCEIKVEFIVEKDGSISDVKIKRNYNTKEECEEEALRLIREMPKWKPGKKNINGVDKKVRARMSKYIDF